MRDCTQNQPRDKRQFETTTSKPSSTPKRLTPSTADTPEPPSCAPSKQINKQASIHLSPFTFARPTSRYTLETKHTTMLRRAVTTPGLSAFEQAVGNTKLLRLNAISEQTGCNIFGKCEYENPGGSIKDRAALWMVRDAEERGELVRGEPGVIIEGTAGNTGVGLALAAGVFGYKCIIAIAETQSVEKKNLLRWAGAHLVEVPAVPYKDPNNYVHVARRISEEIARKGTVRSFYANQWDNLSNRKAHYESTGPEIYEQLDGKVDAFSCAMGTGGTLSGTSQFLRQVNPDIMIALTDPCGAALVRYFNEGELQGVGSSISEGIGQGRITGNIEGFTPDIALEVSDEVMVPVLEDLQRTEGLALGGSAGINGE
jgi:cysteine synthase A